MPQSIWEPGKTITIYPNKTNKKLHTSEDRENYFALDNSNTDPVVKRVLWRVNENGNIELAIKDINENKIYKKYPSIQAIADGSYFGYTPDTTQKIQRLLTKALEERSVQVGYSPGNPNTTPTPAGRTPGSSTNPDTGTNPANDNPVQLEEGSFGVTIDDFYNDNYKLWNAQYPEDMNGSQDRIVINQVKYKIANVLEKGKLSSSKIVEEFSNENRYVKTDILGTVILPMPNNISETNVTAWGDDSMSSLAALIMGKSTGVAGSLAEFDLGKATEEIMKSFEQAFGPNTAANQTIRQLLTLNAGAAVARKFGVNVNPEAFRTRITGTAINPNLELLFQGPKLRSFGFEFKMTPRSKEEAIQIRKILKFFKKGMAPKRGGSGESAYFLGAPNVFDIKFMSGSTELKSIGRIKTCALQQCSINYTPEGFYAAFTDQSAGGSQPISVVMSLTFTELTPLYDQNYDDSDSVGYDKLLDGLKDASVPTNAQIQITDPNALPLPPGDRGNGVLNLERYQNALKLGYKGTFQEWLNTYSIKGPAF